jgi:hypothetical protein
MKKRIESTIIGHSFPLNLVAIIVQFIGLILLALPFFQANTSEWLFVGGLLLLITSIIILFLFKGYRMMGLVARVLLGSYSIFSGLLKANDPIGYSQKWAKLLQDDVIAVTLKNTSWFNDFSLAFLSDYSFIIVLFVLLLEIVIGVLLLIGGLPKLTAWISLFALFVTSLFSVQQASYSKNTTYLTYKTVASNSSEAQVFIKKHPLKKEQNSRIKHQKNVQIPIVKQAFSTNDFTLFSFGFNGVVGRSLTSSQSLLMYLILLFYACWFFAARRTIQSNTITQNWKIIPISLLILSVYCCFFNWYFPLVFSSITLLGALWLNRSGGKNIGNYFGVSLILALIVLLFVRFTISYEPIKDFRAFAVGQDINRLVIASKNSKSYSVFQSVDFQPTIQSGQLSVAARSIPFVQHQLETGKSAILLRPYLLTAKSVLCLVIKRLDHVEQSDLNAIRFLLNESKYELQTVLITMNQPEKAREFCNKNGFEIPVFYESAVTMNQIARSNAVLLALKKGKIIGKYTIGALPKWNWLALKIENN